jgi:hypothetical protein
MGSPGSPVIAHVIDGLGSVGGDALLLANLSDFSGCVFEHVVIVVLEENGPFTPQATSGQLN